jgi:hypothetical protein
VLIDGKVCAELSPAGARFVNYVSPDRIPETIAKDLDHDRPLDLSTNTWYYRRCEFLLYQIVWPNNNDGLYPWSPKDPPVLPNQAGTGGTFNFQLHPAFWFGIAMCDTQSYPNPGNGVACTADSEANLVVHHDRTGEIYYVKLKPAHRRLRSRVRVSFSLLPGMLMWA